MTDCPLSRQHPRPDSHPDSRPDSRHNHFPRADAARRCARDRAAAGLAAKWRADDALPGGICAAIDEVADLSPDRAIARLAPRLADRGWLRGRLEGALALLAADPFARPPLPLVGGGEGAGGLILVERGAVRLSLQLHSRESRAAPPAAALFVPGAAAVHVVAGAGAMLHLHHVEVDAGAASGQFTASTAARCHSDPPRALHAGETLILDTARSAFTVSGARPSDARGDVLLLELAVQPPSPLPIRSYDIATGRLIHVSASRRDSSFRTMALALLRSFHRADAAPLFVEATHADDFAARWNAVRELVALDPAAARPRLGTMAASDPHPEIRRAAAATLALYAPQEIAPCPA